MSSIRKPVILTPVAKPPEVPTVIEVPTEIAPLIDAISELKEKLKIIEQKLINIEGILTPEVYDYFYDESTVVKGKPKTYRFKDEIGRDSKNGYIMNDGDEAIYIKINDGAKIKLKSGELFTWGTPIGRRIIIRKMEVSTESTSSQSFRVFAI